MAKIILKCIYWYTKADWDSFSIYIEEAPLLAFLKKIAFFKKIVFRTASPYFQMDSSWHGKFYTAQKVQTKPE